MLVDLRAALQKGTTAAITQPQAVHGLGGVGKTQLAVEYAWKHQADYDVGMWIGAELPAELQANVAGLAKFLNLLEAASTEEAVKVEAVLGWLREHRRWLMILDNADTKEAQIAVQKMLPSGLPGHVIITSRRADWPIGYVDLEVPLLSEGATKDFLFKRAKRNNFNPGTEVDALAVGKELGYLPLALEQAGAYIAKHRVTFAEYLALLKQARPRLLEFHTEGGTGYQKPVAETWLVSERQLSLTARAILQMVAFLAPDEIPRKMFEKGSETIAEGVKLLKDQNIPSLSPKENIFAIQPADVFISETLAELADLSLIEWEDQGFSCHRLLQAALHDRLKPEECKRWIDLVLQLISKFAPRPPSDVRTWTVWDRLRPHATAVLREAWGQTNPAASRLMGELAVLLRAKAIYSEAEPLYRRALAIDEKHYGSEHPEVSIDLNNLAQLLKDTNRLAEAEPLMRWALTIDEKGYGSEHPSVAIRLNNLASLLQNTNRPEEAEPMMRRALAIDEKGYGPEHPNVAVRLNNLASLLQTTNRLAEAEPMLQRALAIDEKNYGSEHPEVAIDLNNLAQFLQDTNQLAKAEPLMRRVVAIFEKSMGPEHPNVATALDNLAQLLKVTDRLEEAELLTQRALTIDEKSYGSEHPSVAIRLNNLALLFKDTNRLKEAEPLTKRVVAIFEKSMGPEHPNLATALNNLALLLQDTNRLEEAEPLMRRALAIDEKSYGSEHPNVAVRLNNLAWLLQDTNRLKEAEPLMKRMILIFKLFNVATGHEHPNWQVAIGNYVGLLEAMGLGEKEIKNRVKEVMEGK